MGANGAKVREDGIIRGHRYGTSDGNVVFFESNKLKMFNLDGSDMVYKVDTDLPEKK